MYVLNVLTNYVWHFVYNRTIIYKWLAYNVSFQRYCTIFGF